MAAPPVKSYKCPSSYHTKRKSKLTGSCLQCLASLIFRHLGSTRRARAHQTLMLASCSQRCLSRNRYGWMVLLYRWCCCRACTQQHKQHTHSCSMDCVLSLQDHVLLLLALLEETDLHVRCALGQNKHTLTHSLTHSHSLNPINQSITIYESHSLSSACVHSWMFAFVLQT